MPSNIFSALINKRIKRILNGIESLDKLIESLKNKNLID